MSDIIDIGNANHVSQISTEMFRATATESLQWLENNKPVQMQSLRRAGLDSVDGMLSQLDAALSRMATLRHADVIDPDNAAHWLAGMLVREPERMLWHVERADGIGASGIWNYVAEDRGQRAHMSCARLEDERRLFMRFPDEATLPMERGTYLEDVLRQAAHQLYQLQTDRMAMDAFGGPGLIEAHPWMMGNPDDIVTQASRPEARMVIDYKCPSEEHDNPDEVADYYIAQTHQYGLMSSQAGFPVHEMRIVNLVLPGEMSAVWTEMVKKDPDMAAPLAQQLVHMVRNEIDGVGLQVQNVKFDRALVHDILRVGDRADALVQKGELSPWPPRPEKIPVDQLDQDRLDALEAQYISASAVIKAADARKTAIKQELEEIGSRYDLEGSKAPIDLVDVKSARKVKPQAFADLMESAGRATDGAFGPGEVNIKRLLAYLEEEHPQVDIEQFRMRGSLSQKNAMKALQELNLSDAELDLVAPTEVSARVTMKRKGPIAERKQEITDLVTQQVEAAIDVAFGMNDQQDMQDVSIERDAPSANEPETTTTRTASASPTH